MYIFLLLFCGNLLFLNYFRRGAQAPANRSRPQQGTAFAAAAEAPGFEEDRSEDTGGSIAAARAKARANQAKRAASRCTEDIFRFSLSFCFSLPGFWRIFHPFYILLFIVGSHC